MAIGVETMRSHTLSLSLMLVILFAIALLIQEMPAQESYHQFADKRTFIETPNFLNVVSNSLFLIPSFLGIELLALNNAFSKERYERAVYFTFFICAGLIALGSTLYDLNPNAYSLMWRRLPIAMSLMSLSAIMITERISERAGFLFLFPLLLVGCFSVIYWEYIGDVCLYRFIELLPFLYYIPHALSSPLARYKHSYFIVLSLVWIILAHLSGVYDHTVYRITGRLFSGHTVEHIFSVLAVMSIYRYLEKNLSHQST
jgi:hypothetical protein